MVQAPQPIMSDAEIAEWEQKLKSGDLWFRDHRLTYTTFVCAFCGQKRTIETYHYKFRLLRSRSGRLFCCRACTGAFKTIYTDLHLGRAKK